MTDGTNFVGFFSVLYFLSFIYFATSENNSFVDVAHKSSMNRDVSHENMHSQNAEPLDIVKQSSNKTSNLGLIQDPHRTIKRILKYKDKALSENILQKSSKVIATEGGSFSLKADHDNNTLNHNVINKNSSMLSTSLPLTSAGKKINVLPPLITNTSIEETNPKINSITSTSPYSSVSPATTKKIKKKPIFTMIPSEEDNIVSFIESSTTGRDFVLPIVLCILALPLVGYIAKLIYRRGTEFTERQQYHRMYLIDGMYNSR